jgi:hypothetical protein
VAWASRSSAALAGYHLITMTNLFITITLLLAVAILPQANLRGHRGLVAKTGSMLPTIPINSSSYFLLADNRPESHS